MAGTPASSVGSAAAAGAIDHVAATGNVVITATSEATAQVLVTGTSLVWDGTTAYLFQFFAPEVFSSATGTTFQVILFDGTNPLGTFYNLRVAVATTDQGSINGWVRIVPAAGTRAYSVRGYSSGAASVTVGAGAGGSATNFPMFLRVTAA